MQLQKHFPTVPRAKQKVVREERFSVYAVAD